MPSLPFDVEDEAGLLEAAAESLDYFDRLIVKAAETLGIISDEELVEAGVLPGFGSMQVALRELAEAKRLHSVD